jgi:hypothetical protein
MLGKSFGQILGGFSLSSSSGTSRSSTDVQVKSTHECHITFIGQRSNNQTHGVSKIFITVGVISLDTFDSAVLVFPVISKLLEPFEFLWVVNLLVYKPLHDFLSVHINDDKSIESQTLKFLGSEFSDHGNSVEEFSTDLIVILLDSQKTFFLHAIFDIISPVNLRSIENTLSSMSLNPISTLDFAVINN